MISKEARQAAALQRFAEANPHLLEEIRALDAREQAQQIQWPSRMPLNNEASSPGSSHLS